MKTPCFPFCDISDDFCSFDLWVKDESVHCTGTYKDRRSARIVDYAFQHGFETLVLITAGNAGYSLARACQGTGLRVVCLVDIRVSLPIRDCLASCSDVYSIDLYDHVLTDDEIFDCVRLRPNERIFHVSNGFESAYSSILDDLSDLHPDWIVLPIGSGEAFVGLANAIEERNMPLHLFGVRIEPSPAHFADKLSSFWTPYEDRILALQEQGHRVLCVDENTLKQSYNHYKSLLKIEPSSAVVFSVLHQYPFSSSERVILLNSGCGIF